jgi:hypothetical protein
MTRRALELCVARACARCYGPQEIAMQHSRSIKNVPFFPAIPLVPAALLVGSLVTAISALVRVRRLERQMMPA